MLRLTTSRHAVTTRNEAGDLMMRKPEQGGPDYDPHFDLLKLDSEDWGLTDQGRKDADEAGKWMRGEGILRPVNLLMVSDLGRTFETALGLNIRRDLLGYDARWNERSWGSPLLHQQFTGEEYVAFMVACGNPDWRAPVEGAQSIRDLYPSVEEALNEIGRLNMEDVHIISSAGPILCAQSRIWDGNDENLGRLEKLGNGHISTIQWEIEDPTLEGRWSGRVRSVNPLQQTKGEWIEF